MGMWTTELQDEMKTVVAELSNASQACYGNHSYAAGYLESVVVDLLKHAPKRRQRALISDLCRVSKELRTRAQNHV